MNSSNSSIALADEGHSGSSAFSSTDWWLNRTIRVPDWPVFNEELPNGILCNYALAMVFLICSCSAMMAIRGQRSAQIQRTLRRHIVGLNMLLFIMAAVRAFSLFIDPYGSRKLLPSPFKELLSEIPFPCLLAAFALLHIAFNQFIENNLTSSARICIGKVAVIIVFVGLHLATVLTADLLWQVHHESRVLWLLSQTSFAIWGLYSCLGFFWSCLQLQRKIRHHPVFLVTPIRTDHIQLQEGGATIGNLLDHHVRSEKSSSSNTNSLTVAIWRGAFKPKIRITDENEQTFSYHSETPSQPNYTDSCQENSRAQSPEIESSSDTYSRKPSAISRTSGRSGIESAAGSRKVSTLEGLTVTEPQLNSTSFESNRQQSKGSSRVQEMLRNVIVVSLVGIIVCLCQIYELFGPHGVFTSTRYANPTEWFIHSLVQRISEVTMALLMINITTQTFSMYNFRQIPSRQNSPQP